MAVLGCEACRAEAIAVGAVGGEGRRRGRGLEAGAKSGGAPFIPNVGRRRSGHVRRMLVGRIVRRGRGRRSLV
jgi:hypothetical protein